MTPAPEKCWTCGETGSHHPDCPKGFSEEEDLTVEGEDVPEWDPDFEEDVPEWDDVYPYGERDLGDDD